MSDDKATAAAGRDFPGLEERETFLVHRVNAKLALACNPAFAALDIDLYSSRILVALRQHERLRIGELVELMVLPQSTISHQVKRMERQGFVRRTRSATDNRTVEVTLTDHGAATAERCDTLSRTIYDAVTAGFSREELEQLNHLLRRMYDGIPQNVADTLAQ